MRHSHLQHHAAPCRTPRARAAPFPPAAAAFSRCEDAAARLLPNWTGAALLCLRLLCRAHGESGAAVAKSLARDAAPGYRANCRLCRLLKYGRRTQLSIVPEWLWLPWLPAARSGLLTRWHIRCALNSGKRC